MPDAAADYVDEKIKAAVNAFYDAHGVVRPGRDPDYINGRWCIGCHNSLPLDWRGPCDVCGKVNEVSGGFNGLTKE